MKIVAIDFETANGNAESACALGVVEYENGEFLNEHHYLIRPHNRYNYFTNTWINHIKKEDVENEKEFYEYYLELESIFKDSIFVAHNAPFDLNVLNKVCDLYGLDHFKNKYIDTVAISRKVFPELYNHRLDTVSNYLNIILDHHNPLSDSYACLLILIKAMNIYKEEDVNVFLKRIGANIKQNN